MQNKQVRCCKREFSNDTNHEIHELNGVCCYIWNISLLCGANLWKTAPCSLFLMKLSRDKHKYLAFSFCFIRLHVYCIFWSLLNSIFFFSWCGKCLQKYNFLFLMALNLRMIVDIFLFLCFWFSLWHETFPSSNVW